jgi:FMN reductase
MSDVVTLAGSPLAASTASAILTYARSVLEGPGFGTSAISVRDLNAEDRMGGRHDSPALRPAQLLIEKARALVIATPVYQTAYSGVLQAFLDLLSPNALAGKVVLPIATGKSPTQLLSIEYALKPVLSALGAQHLLAGVFMADTQPHSTGDDALRLEAETEHQLQAALYELAGLLVRPGFIALHKMSLH